MIRLARAVPATVALALGMVMGYGVTAYLAIHSGPYGFDSIDLVTAGAASSDLVLGGQYWRLGTAPFLHASPMHLLVNLIGLVSAGVILERRMGGRWLLRIAMLSVFTQSQFSIWANPPTAITIGSSGIVCALMTAVLATTAYRTSGYKRILETLIFGGTLVASCLPWTNAGQGIDVSAHLGGLVTGLCYGFAGYLIARSTDPNRDKGATLQACALIALVIAAGIVSLATLQQRITQAEIYAPYLQVTEARDRLLNQDRDRAPLDSLAARYPQDPRIAIAIAGDDITRGAYGSARLRLAGILENPATIRPLGLDIPVRALVLLSYAALLDGDAAGARKTAAFVCPLAGNQRWTGDNSLIRWINDLHAKGLCPVS